MHTKLFTFLFISLILLCCISVSGQSTSMVDKNATFVVNPNPDVPNPNSDVVIEEIFGLNQNTFGPSGLRGRGNIFLCTTPRKLVEHRLYLNLTGAANMWFVVYEGTALNGIYNLVHSINVPNQGPGEGWYSSGAIDFDFQAGMYYAIYPQWDVNANYYTENPVAPPYPIPASFGELVTGVGWDWAPTYGDPPPATQTVTVAATVPVAYYQTIVTDDLVPVELTSFTYNLDGNSVTLNWNTSTETNNLGFEAQRSNNGEFKTIGFVDGYGTTTESHSYSFVDSDLQPGVYSYRLKQVDMDGTVKYYDELIVEVEAPVEYALQQNYPNPFNPSTKIAYSLAVDSRVTLTVYNLLGETVATLINGNVSAGEQDFTFDASGLNSGVYFYSLSAGNFVQTRKMILLK